MKASLKRWVGRVPDMSAVIARFPIAVLLMAIFTAVLIFIDTSSWDEELGRSMFGVIIAAYLCVCVTLAREAKKQHRLIPLQLISSMIIIVLAWFSETLRLNGLMAVGAVLLLLGNMVIWRKSRDDIHVWDFTHKIWTGAIFAVVGSVIFTLGLLAIQAALKSLFGLSINELSERLLFPIGLGFLAPLYWMSTIPPTDETYQELYDNPGFVSKAVSFLGTWLLAPLTLIYAAILLAYGVKIALAGSLPKGEIAQLVTPFLIIGTLTWLLLEPPFVKTKMLAKVFRKAWFPISIPAALLLAVAVFTRVNEYGLTPDRIALIFAVLWALGLGVWFSFGPKEKRDIRLIPASASLLLVFGVFGAGWLSIANQSARLDTYLSAAGITADMQTDIKDNEAAQKAKGAIDYLYRKNGKEALKKSLAKAGYKDRPINLDSIYESLKLQNVKSPSRYPKELYQSQRYDRGKGKIDVSGYDSLHGIFRLYTNERARIIVDLETITVRYSEDKFEFTRIDDGSISDRETLHSFDLIGWAASLPDDNANEGKISYDGSPLKVYQDETTRISLVIDSLSRWSGEEGDMNMNLEFYLLTGPAQ